MLTWGAGEEPPPRSRAGFVALPPRGVALLYGGRSLKVCAWHAREHAPHECMHARVHPPEPWRCSAAGAPLQASIFLNDTYVLEAGSLTWGRVALSGVAPVPRECPALCAFGTELVLVLGGSCVYPAGGRVCQVMRRPSRAMLVAHAPC